MTDRIYTESEIAADRISASGGVPQSGNPSASTCPLCHGTLSEIHNGEVLRFRRRVVRLHTGQRLISANSRSLESALCIALRTLEESATLSEQLAQEALDEGHHLVYAAYRQRATEKAQQAEVIRRVLVTGEQPGGNEGGS